MAQMIRTVMLSIMLAVSGQIGAAVGAEREQVRMVINLLAGVKMPFPENLRNNLAHTERVQLDTNGATVACLRLDDKIRWCYEHIAPVGARAEMLRIRNEPVPGLLVGQIYRYVDDFDLDRAVDIGIFKENHSRRLVIVAINSVAITRKLYDEGMQIALKYLGE